MDLVHLKTFRLFVPPNMQNYGNEISQLMDAVNHPSRTNDFYGSYKEEEEEEVTHVHGDAKNDVITRNLSINSCLFEFRAEAKRIKKNAISFIFKRKRYFMSFVLLFSSLSSSSSSSSFSTFSHKEKKATKTTTKYMHIHM